MSQHEEKHGGDELKGVAIPTHWKSTNEIPTRVENTYYLRDIDTPGYKLLRGVVK